VQPMTQSPEADAAARRLMAGRCVLELIFNGFDPDFHLSVLGAIPSIKGQWALLPAPI
jgi:hypothetical protein